MLKATYHSTDPDTEVYVGDCRAVMRSLPEKSVDLIFADPPFNWDVPYGEWDDARPRQEYIDFTHEWLDGCLRLLSENGSLWVNIPDVTAFDLSGQYVAEARRRAAANEVAIDCLQADAEKLPFADGSFARVWGNAILHHLDLPIAARELHRILQPGGIAVFCEPWGENPLLTWARRHWAYHGKERTADEQPLRRRHLRALRLVFPSLRIEGHQLLSMVRRVLPAGRLRDRLDRWDARLLRLAPLLAHWCRYVALTMRKDSC